MFFEDKPRATRTDKLCCLALAGLLVTATLVYEATDGRALRAAEADKPPAITVSVPTVVIDTLVEAVETHREARYMEDVPLPLELQETLREACEAHGVPLCLALGLIEVESGFDPEADNGVSQGLMQLNQRYFPADLTPAENIQTGVAYLGELLERYRDTAAALVAYNQGSYKGVITDYARKVLQASEKWGGGEVSEVEWRDIPGYEGQYKVSSDGRVYSIPRKITMRDGRCRFIHGGILSPRIAGSGYLKVELSGGKNEYIHRLVALVFLGMPTSNKEINHKDENKRNNCVSNLEWVTRNENLAYGTRNKRSKEAGMKRARPILAIRDENVCMEFHSIQEAGRAGFSRYHIGRCCRGQAKQYKGYVWRFKDAGQDRGGRTYARRVLEASEKYGKG